MIESSVKGNSLAGSKRMLSTFLTERCVSGLKVRIVSTSSSSNSIR